MKYIIFTDIDGTLYPQDHIISKRNKEIIKLAQEKGVEIVLCTGNGYFNQVEKLANELDIRYCITSNGAGIYDREIKEFIFKKEIDKKEVQDLLEFSIENKIAANWWGENKICVNEHSSEQTKSLLEFVMGLYPDVKNKIEEDVFKIEFYSSKNNIDKIINRAKSDKFELARMKDIHVEITQKGVSKGHAVEWLCNKLNINIENAMAVGDSANDLSMLSICNFSYAMANSSEIVKSTAKFHTSSVEQSGLGEAIEDFLFRNKIK